MERAGAESAARIDWPSAMGPGLTLADALAVALERHIVSGQLRDGDRLPSERDLAARLSVSRGSLRGALRSLEQRGLIVRRQGQGTTVVDPTHDVRADQLAEVLGEEDAIFDALDVRACLEPAIAGRAAERARPADVALLETVLRDLYEAATADDFVQADKTFHRTIAQLTHNHSLVRLLDRTRDLIDLSRLEQNLDAAARAAANRQHRAILTAIADGDAAAATAAATEHIEDMRAELMTLRGVDGASCAPVDSHA